MTVICKNSIASFLIHLFMFFITEFYLIRIFKEGSDFFLFETLFACCQCTFCLLSMYLLHAGNATFSFRIWRIAFLSIRWHYLKYSSIRIFIDPYSTEREKTRQWKLVFWHYWYRVKKCFWYHKTRSSRPKMFIKKCVFENFAKFTWKHLFF